MIWLFYYLVLRQVLAMEPSLASNWRWSSCLHLLSSRFTGMLPWCSINFTNFKLRHISEDSTKIVTNDLVEALLSTLVKLQVYLTHSSILVMHLLYKHTIDYYAIIWHLMFASGPEVSCGAWIVSVEALLIASPPRWNTQFKKQCWKELADLSTTKYC